MMKKYVSILLIVVMTLTSLPLAPAEGRQALTRPSTKTLSSVTQAVYPPSFKLNSTDQTMSADDLDNLITVTSVTYQFDVNRDWVLSEMAKGYQLHHIYQGLEKKQQGNSYEKFMTAQYPNLPLDPLTLHNMNLNHMNKIKSVTDAVYAKAKAVPKPKPILDKASANSVTDHVYSLQDGLLNTSPYDQIALKQRAHKPDQAPYTIGSDNEQISTIDGSLQVSATDLVMSGANGMGFALRRVYDSSRAKDDIYVTNDTNSTRPTPEDELHALGKGWIWDISYIRNAWKVNEERSIYIAGVGSYPLGDPHGINKLSLLGYPYKDLTFDAATEEERLVTKISGKRPDSVLKDHKSGIKQYFSLDGKLVRMDDKFGNWVEFMYQGPSMEEEVLWFIVSSSKDGKVNNQMWFAYDKINHTVTVSMDDKKVIYKKRKIGDGPNGKFRELEVLDEVIDPLGRSTKYGYREWNNLQFNLMEKYRYVSHPSEKLETYGQNKAILLTSIEHPTKALSQFGILGAWEMSIGPYAVEQSIYYSSRHVSYSSASQTKMNSTALTYKIHGSSKYDEKYTLTTTVDDGLKSTMHTYERRPASFYEPPKIFNTEVVSKVNNTNQSKRVQYSYEREKPNPTRIEESFQDGALHAPKKTTVRQYDTADWGLVVSETNPLNVTNRYDYSLPTATISKRVGRALLSSVQALNAQTQLVTEYKYDPNHGEMTQMLSKNNQGALLQQVQREYDPNGNPITVRIRGEQQDTVVKQEFSPQLGAFFPTKQTVDVKNAEGQVTTIVKEADYNRFTGDMISYTDGNRHATTSTYDKLGRVIAEKYPDNTQTTIVYNDVQNTITVTDPRGHVTEKAFDPIGNLIRESNGRGAANHAYDTHGRLIRKGTFTGQFVEYTYDAWDRVIKETAGSQVKQYEYNDIENTKVSIDGRGNRIRETYDVLDRVVKREELKPTGAVVLAQYTYDFVGNVVSMRDANGNETKYEYDALSRLTAVIDAEGKRTAYTYNLAGNLVQIQYADGTVLKKRYDEIGRLIEQIDPKNQSKRFYHDANNNLVKSIDRKGQVHQFGYSNRNFLTSSTTPIPEEGVTYAYDASGNRTVMTDATGTTNYAYFPTGELQSITYPDKTTLSYEYEVRGLRTKQTVSSPSFSSALTVNYAPLFSHPTSLQVIDRNNKVLEKVKYTYDLSQTNLMELSLSRHISEMYTYDGLNLSGITQILGSIRILENFQYDYDNNRNIILKSESGNSFTFTYDKLNRIQTNSQFNETYTYDARDNRSTLTTTNPPVQKGAQYSYDSRNRLTRAVTEDGNTVTYRYNGDGLMVERSQAGETTRYYYDDRKIIVAEGKVEPNGTVTIMYMYVHDPKGRLLGRQVASSNQMQSYLTNGHGDVTEIRDSQGTVLNKYTYDIWGKPLTASELVPNIFRYSSEYWDSTTNLQYLRSRWYDPSIGRFTTEDTYEGELGSPMSLNLYTYVENSPLNHIDPSGHWKTSITSNWMLNEMKWQYDKAKSSGGDYKKWANEANTLRQKMHKAGIKESDIMQSSDVMVPEKIVRQLAWNSTIKWIENDPYGFGLFAWSDESMFSLAGGIGPAVIKQVGAGFIKHSVYNEVRNRFGKEGIEVFIKAMEKGEVGPEGQSGIKRLSGKGATFGKRSYQYEIKVKDKRYGDWRIYGNYDNKSKGFIFNHFDKGLHK
ncbi:RHS repeat domain-containing protein [Paenibacillus sp. 481]|uniref:RHS repeat domain-containing protein n=1 Tax=Paenibacillus sp. 481 TaxID=2835869 RepID=UPI001E6545A4|nr:RHS repeat-associated core domain-containing protein [Paenibacillus sp. 481]UHA74908.1 RHS repeat protein [Paenibacillus sp. 481]